VPYLNSAFGAPSFDIPCSLFDIQMMVPGILFVDFFNNLPVPFPLFWSLVTFVESIDEKKNT
jgi:hypothetical protein